MTLVYKESSTRTELTSRQIASDLYAPYFLSALQDGFLVSECILEMCLWSYPCSGISLKRFIGFNAHRALRFLDAENYGILLLNTINSGLSDLSIYCQTYSLDNLIYIPSHPYLKNQFYLFLECKERIHFIGFGIPLLNLMGLIAKTYLFSDLLGDVYFF